MKKLVGLILFFVLVVPMMPALADDSTANVNIGIGADNVNLNVSSTISKSGTMHIYVNGTEITKTYIIHETHNYDGAIYILNQKTEMCKFNIIALANYTTNKFTIIGSDLSTLSRWIGVYQANTSAISKGILNGTTNIVMELDKLGQADAMLLSLIDKMGKEIDIVDANHTKTELEIRTELQNLRTDLADLRGVITQLADDLTEEHQRADKAEQALQNQIYMLTVGIVLVATLLVLALLSEKIITKKVKIT